MITRDRPRNELRGGSAGDPPPAPSEPITVLLADDHTIFRQGLRRLLDENPRIKVVGETSDGRETLDEVRTLGPKVVLMDITMPGLSGLEATRRIRRTAPGTQVLILSVHAEEEFVARALESGAVGYVLKDIRAPDLFEAIESAARGERYLSSLIAETIVSEYVRLRKDRADTESPFRILTAREREILRLLTEGKSSKEIAADLKVSPKTVETHRANIMRKLDIHNIADLVRYAISRGIVEL